MRSCNNIRRNGLLHEADLLADSYGGKFNPSAGRELVSGLPTAIRGLAKGKMTPQKLLLHQHKAPAEVKKIFDTVEGKSERNELNLYVTGYEDEPEPHAEGAEGRSPSSQSEGATGGEG